MKYQYLTISPHINDGEFNDGYITVKEKSFFGKEKTVYKEVTITEQEWLNRKGQEGWELVNVLRNSMSYDLKDYYFRRAIDE